MITIKNLKKRLITFTSGDKRYPIPCGLDNERQVPDEVVKTDFFKAMEKAGEVMQCGTVIEDVEPEDEELKASERYIELQNSTVKDLRAMAKDMYDISGTSRMKEYDVIKAIIEAEQE